MEKSRQILRKLKNEFVFDGLRNRNFTCNMWSVQLNGYFIFYRAVITGIYLTLSVTHLIRTLSVLVWNLDLSNSDISGIGRKVYGFFDELDGHNDLYFLRDNVHHHVHSTVHEPFAAG